MRALVCALLLVAAPAFAQTPATLRATLDSVSADGGQLQAHAAGGASAVVRFTDATRIAAVIPAALADLRPGAYIGVAAVPEGDGQRALEVHIFPESMRGVGEGFRPFDLAPGSTMTNGALTARVDSQTGGVLTVTYKGGEQILRLDAQTKIVALTPGSRADLIPGAALIARGERAADGAIDARSIAVGRNGLTPPM